MFFLLTAAQKVPVFPELWSEMHCHVFYETQCRFW